MGDLVEKYLGEAIKSKVDPAKYPALAKSWGGAMARRHGSTQMQCMECGHKFKKKLGKGAYEVKCPKCGGYDTDVA